MMSNLLIYVRDLIWRSLFLSRRHSLSLHLISDRIWNKTDWQGKHLPINAALFPVSSNNISITSRLERLWREMLSCPSIEQHARFHSKSIIFNAVIIKGKDDEKRSHLKSMSGCFPYLTSVVITFNPLQPWDTKSNYTAVEHSWLWVQRQSLASGQKKERHSLTQCQL
jgi:hypothetical protein